MASENSILNLANRTSGGEMEASGEIRLVTKTASANLMVQNQEYLISQWEDEVRREIPTTTQMQHPVLIDTLPVFLTNLAEALAEEYPRQIATDANTVAGEHGGERARLSQYEPAQLVREYQILRDVVLNHLIGQVSLTPKEQSTIQKSFDQAVCQAMSAFFLVHSQIRERFTATLTHDLRTPLAVIKMSAEIMAPAAARLPEGEVRDEIESLAKRIVSSAHRADRMIQNLLDANILQIGERLLLRFAECDLMTVIRDVMIELSRRDQSRVHLRGVQVRGVWDCDALRRAIENLIQNAIKYGSPGSPIDIQVGVEHERVTISVHNFGNPIALGDREGLFQVFRRAEEAKFSGKRGWGIGLALVRSVAEGHGGSIAVDSSIETGTTFLIDIPLDSRLAIGATKTL